ncbi:hypothetical protein, partial [Rhodoferax ferrireducens]|uniref:hypothetical protein n=1 Tax=Rhodoferax ferrireducens TaxID=192843 RepID=UPI001E4D0288
IDQCCPEPMEDVSRGQNAKLQQEVATLTALKSHPNPVAFFILEWKNYHPHPGKVCQQPQPRQHSSLPDTARDCRQPRNN